MDYREIFFTCGMCGKRHQALPPIVPPFSEEKKRELRSAWLAADDKLSKSPNNEHLEKAYMKAWFAYGATMANNVPRIPKTIDTMRNGSKYTFICSDHIKE